MIWDEWLEKAKTETAARRKMDRSMIPKGQKCSSCIHHRNHEFSNKYHYCKLGESKHTPNGYAKVKASGWCAKWEEKS